MDKLESEKRNLQIKLDQPVSEPPSPRYQIHASYREKHALIWARKNKKWGHEN
jgi:hypothetical protein